MVAEDFTYTNEEEGELAQIHGCIHNNLNAIRAVQAKLVGPNRSHCLECGEVIGAARLAAITSACSLCIDCATENERVKTRFERFFNRVST